MNELFILFDFNSLLFIEGLQCFIIRSASWMSKLELMTNVEISFVLLNHCLELTLTVKLVQSILRLILKSFKILLCLHVIGLCFTPNDFQFAEFINGVVNLVFFVLFFNCRSMQLNFHWSKCLSSSEWRLNFFLSICQKLFYSNFWLSNMIFLNVCCFHFLHFLFLDNFKSRWFVSTSYINLRCLSWSSLFGSLCWLTFGDSFWFLLAKSRQIYKSIP